MHAIPDHYPLYVGRAFKTYPLLAEELALLCRVRALLDQDTGECDVSIAELREGLGVCDRAARTHLQLLIEARVLGEEPRKGRPSILWLRAVSAWVPPSQLPLLRERLKQTTKEPAAASATNKRPARKSAPPTTNHQPPTTNQDPPVIYAPRYEDFAISPRMREWLNANCPTIAASEKLIESVTREFLDYKAKGQVMLPEPVWRGAEWQKWMKRQESFILVDEAKANATRNGKERRHESGGQREAGAATNKLTNRWAKDRH